MRRIYAQSWGQTMPRFDVPVGSNILDVMALLTPNITLRQPNRWERALEWIEDAPPGRIVSHALRESRAPLYCDLMGCH